MCQDTRLHAKIFHFANGICWENFEREVSKILPDYMHGQQKIGILLGGYKR